MPENRNMSCQKGLKKDASLEQFDLLRIVGAFDVGERWIN